MAKHKHCELIHLWAEGAEIEIYTNEWKDCPSPSWHGANLYRIKPKEPEWYENIPAHGVLCWVGMDTDAPQQYLMLIIKHLTNNGYPYVDKWQKRWKLASPLTNDEIKQFLRG